MHNFSNAYANRSDGYQPGHQAEYQTGHQTGHQTELPASFPAEFPVEFSEEFPADVPTSSDTAPLAIASVPCQSLGSLYEDEHALQVGTVFPELDMPFFAGGDPNGR